MGDRVDPDAATIGALGDHDPATPAREFAPGMSVGRFIVTKPLGEGGMGIVLAAVDPTLDRAVAIKVLRGTQTDDARCRLLREAQALARLSHENVVPIYEAGEADGEVYVVMELVKGRTLASWLSETPHGWREIVSVFVRAGRGLEAAHAAGLVHRDFKPENVLIGADGRVRVSDFGLAASRDDIMPATRPSGDDLLAIRLTRTGGLVGTPAFMAPEQYTGSVDPRTDQFAFCVALYQALFDRLPFRGGATFEYLANVTENNVQPPPRERAGPRWLWRALVRGLRAKPDERFPDMSALLTEIDREHRRRLTVIRIAATGLIVAAFAAVAWKAFAPATGPSCGDAEAAFGTVWNAEHRSTVRAAFARTARPWQAKAGAAVEAALDARDQEWRALRGEICEASRAGTETEARLDLKVSCLDGQLGETRAVVGLLEHADGELVTRAGQIVAAFTPIASCADAGRLAGPSALPDDPTTRVEIEAIRALLAESRALYSAAHYRDSLTRAKIALERARNTGYPPVVAEAMYRRAIAAERVGRTEGDPNALLFDAIAAAGAAHHDAVLVDAWTRMARTCAEEAVGTCDAELAIRMARGALSALGHDDRRESLLLDAESMQAEARSNHVAAKSLREEALRLAVRAADGRRDASVARAHGNLGQLLASMGEDPRSEINQALAIYRELGGDYHPELAPGLEALAIYASSRATGKPGAACDAACRGYRKEAEDRFREALEIRRQAFGEIHGDVAASHNNLSYLFFQIHDYDRSVAEIRASLAIYEQLEPDGPKVAETVVSLGEVLDQAGQPKQALAAYQRALALREKQLGPEHREVAVALSLVGRRNRRDGKFDEALSAFRRALRIYEQVDGKQAETANETRQEIAYAEHRDTRDHASRDRR